MRQPRVEAELEAVVDRPVDVRVHVDQLLGVEAGLGRIQVEHRDRLAVAERVGDLERREVAHRDQRILLRFLVVVPAMVVARVHREARQELMLHADGALDVVLAAQTLAGESRLQPEQGVRARTDLVVLRDVVEVQVSPRPAVAHLHHRVVPFRPSARPRQHVLVHAGLDGRPRVAEQVVDDGEPRREVVPLRHVILLIHAEPGRETARRPADRIDAGVEVIPAKAARHRQALQRPRVLDVDAAIGPHVFVVA